MVFCYNTAIFVETALGQRVKASISNYTQPQLGAETRHKAG